jgi:hypothetical protein
VPGSAVPVAAHPASSAADATAATSAARDVRWGIVERRDMGDGLREAGVKGNR